MRVVLVLSAVLAFAMAHHHHHMMPKEVMEARKTCMTELGIEMPKFEKGKPLEKNPKFKCLDKCVLEKLEVINAAGAFNDKNVPEDLKEPAKACFEENKDLEACERAHKYMKCTFKAIGGGMRAMCSECAKKTNTAVTCDRHGGGKGHGHGVGGHFAKLEEEMKDESKACFHRCMMIGMKKIDEKGDFLVDGMSFYVPDGVNIKEVADTCSKANMQEDECIKAANRGLCVFQELKKNFKQ